MRLKLAGYEMAPQEQYHRDLMAYAGRVAEGGQVDNPPMAAKPVYADAEGNHYVALPTENGVAAMPFVPGSPAQGSSGGFVPVEQMPQGGAGDDLGGLWGVMAEGVPAGNVVNWLGNAATNGMLAGAPGTGVAGALSTLGLNNPMAQGALGAAVTAAGNSAGLGPLTGLLSGALSGGGAGAVGGQLANLASVLTNGGGFTGALNQAASTIGGMLGGGLPDLGGIDPGLLVNMDGANPEAALNTLLAGKGPNVVVMDEIPKSGLPDLNAIGSQALDGAADQLLSQWKVDDESSAAEQVAHKAVTDNKDAILDAAKDPDGFMKRIQAIFSGASSAAKYPIARIGDLDVKPPYLIQVGVATILAQGKPVSRITDPLTPSGPIILEGAATVLSAGLPTARLTHTTSAPAMKIIQGAATVLVGGPSAKVDPPAKAPDAENKSNAAPKGPATPKKSASGSGKGGGGGEGKGNTGNGSDSTKGTAPKGGATDQTAGPSAEPPSTQSSPTNAAAPEQTPPTSTEGSAQTASSGNTTSQDSPTGSSSATAGAAPTAPSPSGSNPPPADTQASDALLCIHSNVAEGQGNPGLTDGHANLSLHQGGATTTYGTWPDDHPDIAAAGLSNGDGSDIRTNYSGDDPSQYPYTHCEQINQEQLNRFQQALNQGSTWTYPNNCSSWASETFNDVTGTDIDADDVLGIDTPREVGQHIVEANGGVASNASGPTYPVSPNDASSTAAHHQDSSYDTSGAGTSSALNGANNAADRAGASSRNAGASSSS